MPAAIFDLDGLLIDSEPFWQEAEVAVLGSLGVPLTREMCRQTVGLRIDTVVKHWHAQYPWHAESLQATEARILSYVSRRIDAAGQPMPGALHTLDLMRDAGYVLAVASSSPLRLIRDAVAALGVGDRFELLHSAEDEAAGKPDPAVYRSTMRRLGAEPADCVAFEDSAHGVASARAAGARVVAVPDPVDAGNPAFAAADIVLPSLTEFRLDLLD